MSSKVVVHFKDHSVLKGTASEIGPNTETFTLTEINSGGKRLIHTEKIKAVFFVKTFEGNPDQKRKEGFHLTHAFGTKTVVRFHDGEVVYGFSEDYSPYTKGFFLYPAYQESNNMKIFIPRTSVLEIKIGQDIDKTHYGQAQHKFLKRIVPKVVQVTIQACVGERILDGVDVKIQGINQTITIKPGQSGITVPLKPGKYVIELTYQTYKITREIEVATDKRFYKIDFQSSFQ